MTVYGGKLISIGDLDDRITVPVEMKVYVESMLARFIR
mgnify:CR=1 FL=1